MPKCSIIIIQFIHTTKHLVNFTHFLYTYMLELIRNSKLFICPLGWIRIFKVTLVIKIWMRHFLKFINKILTILTIICSGSCHKWIKIQYHITAPIISAPIKFLFGIKRTPDSRYTHLNHDILKICYIWIKVELLNKLILIELKVKWEIRTSKVDGQKV